MESKKVVVTGGAGFLGSQVVELLLKKGNFVVVLDDFSNGKMSHLAHLRNDSRLKIYRGDITNINDVKIAFKDCNIVIHLAVLDLRQSIIEPQRVNKVIVNGTLNCLDIARLNNVELFINCSSSEVYGTAIYVPMDENHPLNPETPYAAAKVAQDMYVSSYGKTYGLPWITIRPFNMYGPNCHWQGFRGELIPKMIVRSMNRKPLTIYGNGDQTRDFTHVREVARAVITIAKNNSPHNMTVNYCNSAETSVQRVAELICKHFGLDTNVFIRKEERRPGDVTRHFGDNTKFEKLYGFTPEINIEEGIQRTIEWFKGLPYSPEELLAQELEMNWKRPNARR